jgi:hypothetical protein
VKRAKREWMYLYRDGKSGGRAATMLHSRQAALAA